MNRPDYKTVIGNFAGKKILVIGDLILDIYLKGTSHRLSPEAPVPVVDVANQTYFLGGSGNVVCNLRSLGAEVQYCTVAGRDEKSEKAITLLQNIQVPTEFIIRSPDRETISKTRVIAGTHVITRFDQGSTTPLDPETEDALLRNMTEQYQYCDAILISDYDKGVITERVLSTIMKLQARWPKFIAVDSKRLFFFSRLHPYLVKPNYEEAITLLGAQRLNATRINQIEKLANELYERINAEIIAVTLDAEGSAIIELGQLVYHCETSPVLNAHVAGAGDTYFSAFLLAYMVTADSRTSADIANAAASISVRKEDTSSCTAYELTSYFSAQNKVVNSADELKLLCDEYHRNGKRIVFTNGCFDILHSGHVTYLHCARELGDVLIVGVNTDDSIRRLKGEQRPINPITDRLLVLSALTSVDHLFAFGDERDDTPIPVINIVKPDVFAKGGDYTRDRLPEASAIESHGGKIVFLPHIPDHSTTSIIRRIGSSTPTSDQAIQSNR